MCTKYVEIRMAYTIQVQIVYSFHALMFFIQSYGPPVQTQTTENTRPTNVTNNMSILGEVFCCNYLVTNERILC